MFCRADGGEEDGEVADGQGQGAAVLGEEWRGKLFTTEALAEWEYGLYEGLVTREIREGRRARGLDAGGEWDIWRDGCEEGE